MAFDLRQWKEKVHKQLQGWKPRMKQTGVNSIYAFLYSATVWPIVAAYMGGDPTAFFALGNVLAGIGSNLLANRIQDWKDEADAAQKIAAEAPYNPDLRTELDVVLERLEALPLARQALSEDEHQWFAETLREELDRMGNRSRSNAVLSGAGAIAQGPGAAATGAE